MNMSRRERKEQTEGPVKENVTPFLWIRTGFQQNADKKTRLKQRDHMHLSIPVRPP